MPDQRDAAAGSTRTVWHLGLQAPPQKITAVVTAFCRAARSTAALVAPFDGPLTTDPAARTLEDTLWGWIAAPTAECRWRVEGTRALASVVAERELDGLDLHPDDAVAVSGPEVAFERGVQSLLGSVTARVVEYHRDGRPWLTRLEVSS